MDDSRGDILIGFAGRLVGSAGWKFTCGDDEHLRNMTDIEWRQRMDQRRVCLELDRLNGVA